MINYDKYEGEVSMKIATVGLPCQIEGLRKVEILKDELKASWIDDVYLKIGLFCRENWMFSCFRALVEDDYGVKMEEVEKFDIKKRKIIGLKNGEKILEIPLEESQPYVRVGCQVCLDFTAELSDISVGAVGSDIKWSTVIIRTKRGKEIFDGAVKEGYIEVSDKLKLKIAKRISKDKRESNLKEIEIRENAGYKVLHVKTFFSSLEDVKNGAKGKDFSNLESDIVEQGNCTSCGTCASVCDHIEIKEGFPTLVKPCEENCNLCYLACPRVSLPKKVIEDSIFSEDVKAEDYFGKYIEIYAARAKNEEVLKKGQDGGVVTALLMYALDKGIVDLVVTAGREKNWEPKVAICKTREDVLNSAGTIYSYVTIAPSLRMR